MTPNLSMLNLMWAVVIRAGFIDLEFAAARKHGIEVTVLEYADRPMARALTSVTGAWFAKAHQAMGTELRRARVSLPSSPTAPGTLPPRFPLPAPSTRPT